MNLRHIAFLIVCIVSPSLWLANKNREMNLLADQVDVEVGGNVDQFERWNPNLIGHGPLLNQLGGRVTNEAPLRLLWMKNLTPSDVSSQQARFVFSREIVEKIIFRCLTFQQRAELCNYGAEIQIAAFDEQGRKRVLKLKKRMQAGQDEGTYVLKGKWAKMVRENGWKDRDDIKIWGLPYAGREDQWRFGPHHDFNDITFVFTTTV